MTDWSRTAIASIGEGLGQRGEWSRFGHQPSRPRFLSAETLAVSLWSWSSKSGCHGQGDYQIGMWGVCRHYFLAYTSLVIGRLPEQSCQAIEGEYLGAVYHDQRCGLSLHSAGRG